MIRMLALISGLIFGSTLLSAQNAKEIIANSLHSFGGDVWQDINYLKTHYYSHGYWLEQSENPEGPFITSYEDVLEIRSLNEQRLYLKKEMKYLQTTKPDTSELVLNGNFGMMRYGSFTMPFQPISGLMDRSKSWLYYCPIKLLRAISDNAVSAFYNGRLALSGVPHHEITFSSKELSGKILINANTLLLTEAYIDTYWPHEYYFSIWGRFQTRIQYSLYSLEGAMLYPRQWNISQNGQAWQQVTINQIELLKKCDESVFSIPQDIKDKTEAPINVNELKPPFNQLKQIAPGVHLIEEAWNTGWVEQENGIVIIEAPISSGYSNQMIQEMKRRFSGKPIKSVIVTSDAWPHLGGSREYMAEGIPIFSSYLNRGVLNKLSEADYSTQPDSYQNKQNKPVFKWIKEPITIDDKNCPITIYPVNGEGGERMVVIYFPKQKLLYASDLIQYLDPSKKVFFFPEYLYEVTAVVKKYNLNVDTVYAMHLEPTPWKEVEDYLAKVKVKK